MKKLPEIVLSTCKGADHMVERLIGSTDPDLMPGTLMSQATLENLEKTRRIKITLVRRK